MKKQHLDPDILRNFDNAMSFFLTDRTPIDCWLYQKQFVEKLEAEYGTREQFLDEFNIDIFVGFVPYPNPFGRLFDVSELVDVDLGDPRDPKNGCRTPIGTTTLPG
jgi:hypothetical protein